MAAIRNQTVADEAVKAAPHAFSAATNFFTGGKAHPAITLKAPDDMAGFEGNHVSAGLDNNLG
jgi:hypothetical protein